MFGFGFVKKIFQSKTAKLARAVKESRDVYTKGAVLYQKYHQTSKEVPEDVRDFLKEVSEAHDAICDLF